MSGITIHPTSTGNAFSMISFMVGELVYIYKTIDPPVDITKYIGLNEKTFKNLQNKVLSALHSKEVVNLNFEESMLLYMVIDLSCKCLVDKINLSLKELAIPSLEISGEEYDKLRINYLRYAESFIQTINEKFEKNAAFVKYQYAIKAL